MQRFCRMVIRALSSRRFLYAVLGWFVFESLWVALSAVYPMAFDEDFHFGIIKIYSHHWLPFLGGQPDATGAFGPVARDPSYLYHYLMSFPYRFITLFTHDQTIQVICLRLINIALFGVGLVLFWRLLQRVGVSRMLSNALLFLFTLIPIVPLLAGQINYDNLMLPMVAWLCLLVLDCIEQVRAKRIELPTLTLLLVACCLGSIVKYPFLPLAVAAIFFVALYMWRKLRWHRLWPMLRQSYRRMSRWTKIGLAAALVVSLGLALQRYGGNVLAYHTPLPTCDAVLDVDTCLGNGPFARDYALARQNDGTFNHNPLYYAGLWLYGMWLRLFFMITGPALQYANAVPLPLPGIAGILLGLVVAVVLAWRGWRTVRHNPALAFLLGLSLIYILTLFLDNYEAYLRTGQPVAINGRYLLPVLLPLAAVACQAASGLLRSWPRTKVVILAVLALMLLDGGGWLSFVVRSNSAWDWPNHTVVTVNNLTRSLVSPLVIGKDVQFEPH